MVMINFKQCRREQSKNKSHRPICLPHSPGETTDKFLVCVWRSCFSNKYPP